MHAGLIALAHLSPNAAVLLFTLSAAAIALELNRPGLILPGTAGLAGILLAVASLLQQPLRPAAATLAITALVILCLGFRRTLPLAALAAATAALILGTMFLLRPGANPALDPALAGGCALVLGAALGVLGRIARRARRNKGLD